MVSSDFGSRFSTKETTWRFLGEGAVPEKVFPDFLKDWLLPARINDES
jgi:hypothetical protein